MAYSDTPLPTETPSQSQPLMRQNFNTISTFWTPDHVPFSSGSNVGFSNKLTLVEQGSDAGAVNLTDILYSKAVTEKQGTTTYTRDELFIRGYGFDNAFPLVPISKISQVTNQALIISSGEGMLPGGLQIRCGIASTPTPQTFSTQFPTACISVVACASSTPAQVNVTAISATGFTVLEGGAPAGIVSYYWIAIGY